MPNEDHSAFLGASSEIALKSLHQFLDGSEVASLPVHIVSLPGSTASPPTPETILVLSLINQIHRASVLSAALHMRLFAPASTEAVR